MNIAYVTNQEETLQAVFGARIPGCCVPFVFAQAVTGDPEGGDLRRFGRTLETIMRLLEEWDVFDPTDGATWTMPGVHGGHLPTMGQLFTRVMRELGINLHVVEGETWKDPAREGAVAHPTVTQLYRSFGGRLAPCVMLLHGVGHLAYSEHYGPATTVYNMSAHARVKHVVRLPLQVVAGADTVRIAPRIHIGGEVE